MSFTVTFEFGGLCMLVQRASVDPGLYVLMASDDGTYSSGDPHRPVAKVLSTAGSPEVDFFGHFDWRNVLKGGNKPKAFDGTLRFSKASDGGFVPTNLLEGPLSPTLAARCVLPLPAKKPYIYGASISAVALYTDTSGNPRMRDMGKVAGRIRVDYELTGTLVLDSISISSDATLQIANIERNPTNTVHPIWTPMRQQQVEMPLMAKKGVNNLEFLSAEPYNGMLDKDAGSISWVDPVQCTVGSGCPEDDPHCGDA